MSERYAESSPTAADVRSFLPRPGEPVDDYAARLRALHHDLTLVLDAVERGLAAADREAEEPQLPEAYRTAPPAFAPVEAEPEPVELHRSAPPPTPLAAMPRGGARVEVVSTRARPLPPLDEPPPLHEPAPLHEPPPLHAAQASGGVTLEGGSRVGDPPRALPPHAWSQPPSWHASPTEVAFAPPATATVKPADPPGAGARGAIAPWIVTAAVSGWLAVAALILALLLDL